MDKLEKDIEDAMDNADTNAHVGHAAFMGMIVAEYVNSLLKHGITDMDLIGTLASSFQITKMQLSLSIQMYNLQQAEEPNE